MALSEKCAFEAAIRVRATQGPYAWREEDAVAKQNNL